MPVGSVKPTAAIPGTGWKHTMKPPGHKAARPTLMIWSPSAGSTITLSPTSAASKSTDIPTTVGSDSENPIQNQTAELARGGLPHHPGTVCQILLRRYLGLAGLALPHEQAHQDHTKQNTH